MKLPRLILGLAFSAILDGCGPDSSSSNTSPAQSTNASSSSGSVLTAPVDYLGAIAQAKQSAVKTVGLASINEAIRQFQTEHGRLPKDLNELVKEKILVRIPAAPYGSKFVYDPASGEAKVIKQ
ncbi:MAG TPA: hypothetical protein VFD66_12185 [Verrucomicrobiae bacterium]|nr:hypothetical protein [Verrucomicrobiae bacterium]